MGGRWGEGRGSLKRRLVWNAGMLGVFWLFFTLCWSAMGGDQSFVHVEGAQLRQGQLTTLCPRGSSVVEELSGNTCDYNKYNDAISLCPSHNQRWQDWNGDIACSYSSVTGLDTIMWDMINICKLTRQPVVCCSFPKAKLAKYFSSTIK